MSQFKVAVFEKFNLKNLLGIELSNKKKQEEKHLIFTYTPHIQSLGSLLLLKNQYLKMETTNCGDVNKRDLELIKNSHLNSNHEGECYYCKNYFPLDQLNFDHFIPLYLGGEHNTLNLKITCLTCNELKGAIHPDKMPYSWNLFKNNVWSKKFRSSLTLLQSIQNNVIFKSLSELEQHLISKVIVKELEWRRISVSK